MKHHLIACGRQKIKMEKAKEEIKKAIETMEQIEKDKGLKGFLTK